jgi:HK97 family phage major capsid protein
MDMSEVKALLQKQGEAFEAFKNSTAMELVELKKIGAVDPLTADRLAKIEKSLDTAVEAKAQMDAKLDAETKEREELEAKLNRMNFSGKTDEGKRIVEVKEFNDTLRRFNAEKNRPYADLDVKGVEAYKGALVSYIRVGKDNLSPEEVKTLSVGSDADGGYYVTPDTNGRIITKVYESSNIRQIASAQTISTDALEGIEDLGEAGAGYADERATSGNFDTPQIGKWRIPVYWIDTEPKTTQQLLDDASVDVEAWLTGKVSLKFSRFEEKEFCTGASKIRGFTSYPVAADDGSGVAWGKVGYVASGAAADFAGSNPADKIFDLIGALKNEYLINSRFVTRRSVITKIRKFKDGQGNYLWQPSFVLGQPEMIAGYAVTRAEDMPTLGDGALSLAFGDFRTAYQIVDRQGIRGLRDNLTQKPYVKFYTTKRVGGGVVNFEAFKVMKFGTN